MSTNAAVSTRQLRRIYASRDKRPAVTALDGISLEIQVCDQFGCGWATWTSGVGNVSYTCPGTFYAPFRSSRLRSKIVYCTYF